MKAIPESISLNLVQQKTLKDGEHQYMHHRNEEHRVGLLSTRAKATDVFSQVWYSDYVMNKTFTTLVALAFAMARTDDTSDDDAIAAYPQVIEVQPIDVAASYDEVPKCSVNPDEDATHTGLAAFSWQLANRKTVFLGATAFGDYEALSGDDEDQAAFILSIAGDNA